MDVALPDPICNYHSPTPLAGKRFTYIPPPAIEEAVDAESKVESTKVSTTSLDVLENVEANKAEDAKVATSESAFTDARGPSTVATESVVKTEGVPPPALTVPEGCVHIIGMHYNGPALSDRTAINGADLYRGYGFSELQGRRFTKVVECLHYVTGEVLRIFESQTAASDFMGVSKSGISLCCGGKQRDANGFQWRFYEGKVIDFDKLYASRVNMPKELLENMKTARRNADNETSPDSEGGRRRILQDINMINEYNAAHPGAYGEEHADQQMLRDALAAKKEKMEAVVKREKEEAMRKALAGPSIPSVDGGSSVAQMKPLAPREEYTVLKMGVVEATYAVPRTDEHLISRLATGRLENRVHLNQVKPQMSITSSVLSARLLALKAELLNLLFLVPARLMNFDSLQAKVLDQAQSACEAENDPDMFLIEVDPPESDDEDEASPTRAEVNRTILGSQLMSSKTTVKGLTAKQIEVYNRLPVKPNPPVPVWYGECVACSRNSHTAHTRVRDCRLSKSKEESDARVARDEETYNREFETYTMNIAKWNRILGAIYMGKIPIVGYTPMTELPGVPTPDFVLQDSSKRKTDSVSEESATKRIKMEDGSFGTVSQNLTPGAVADDFIDVVGVNIGDWNHVHGQSDIDPQSGKKKRRCENCRPNRGYVCGRCKATNAGLSYDRRRVGGYDAPPNFNTEPLSAPSSVAICPPAQTSIPLSEEAKKEAEEKEKERLLKKEKRLARRAARKKHIDSVFNEIREATTPKGLMQAVIKVEELLPSNFLDLYNKYAVPYDGSNSAAIAARIFVIDRVIRYDHIKGLEKEVEGKRMTFKARTQFSPRCLINPLCCGPLWHACPCASNDHYKFATVLVAGEKRKSHSRCPLNQGPHQ